MSVKKRPGFKTNVERSVRGTQKKSVYYDIKPGQKARLRFTPTSNEDGELFFESSQHFKFTLDGDKRAWACLRQHGDGDYCPICEYLEIAGEILGKPGEKLINDHGASRRWHAQIVPVIEGEAPEQSFIVGLSRTTAEAVNGVMVMERDNRQPLLTDPEAGQIIQIERNTASGFGTRYKVLPTGVRVNLDEFFPEWADKFLNVEEALKLRIEEPDTLIASMKETFGDTIFDALTKALNTKAAS